MHAVPPWIHTDRRISGRIFEIHRAKQMLTNDFETMCCYAEYTENGVMELE
jgi:hypothetical protein